MADPVRLNAPVSSNGASFAPAAAPVVSGPTIASPTSVSLDGRDRSRPTVTAAPLGAPVGLAAPKATVPARPVTTQMIAQPPESLKAINISVADASPFVDESQRVMRDIVGIGFGRQPNTFQPTQVFRDKLGMTHVRMQRMYMGLPVFGEQVITHFDKKGQVKEVTNKDTPAGLAGLSTDPKVMPAQALLTAKATMGVKPNSESSPELVVLKQPNGEYTLAYHIILENFSNPRDPQRNHYFVDATSNKTVLSFNEIHGFMDGPRAMQRNGGIVPPRVDSTQSGSTPAPAQEAPVPAAADKPAPAPTAAADTPAPTTPDCPPIPQPQPAPGGSGNSLYLGNVSLNTTKLPDGSFIMRDMSVRGAEIRDARNTGSTSLGADGFPEGSTPINDYNNVWGESADNPRNRAAIDAQANAVGYDTYLKAMYDRNGIDGQGQQPRAVVHTGDQMVNAFYYGKVMWYGDGDGTTAGPLVDKDVASHEPTHGLTEASSALQYYGESGAINEAMSDILGSAGYSWYARGHNDTGIQTDFWIGEDCWTPAKDGDALRYMDHPTRDREGDSIAYSRDNYSDRYQGWGDNGGVHLNSGIGNNAFFLMAMGGTNDTSKVNVPEGMGIQDALQIFYRMNTVYLTPTSDFASAREAAVKAAVDLFGDDSKQVKIAQQAWTAVGVNAPPATPPKFPLPAPVPAPAPTPAPTSSTDTTAAPTSSTSVPAPTSPAALRRKAA